MRLAALVAATALAAVVASTGDAEHDRSVLEAEASAHVASMATHFVEQESPVHPDDKFAVVFDAGSTGSRMFIFRWPAQGYSTVPLPRTRPFETFAYTENSGRGVLVPDGRAVVQLLLESVKTKYLPGKDYSRIPVFLFATAGLRIADEYARNTAIRDLRAMFRSSGFLSHDPTWVRMISGEEQAAFAFLAVQLMQHNGAIPTDASQLVGAIDMGSASTEIAFKPAGDPIEGSYSLVVRGTGINHTLYQHSYLFGGADEWRKRMHSVVTLAHAEMLVERSPRLANQAIANILDRRQVPHPCYLAGYTMEVVLEALDNLRVTFRGTGDPGTCRTITRQLLYLDAPCLTDPKPLPASDGYGGAGGRRNITAFGLVQELLPPRTGGATRPTLRTLHRTSRHLTRSLTCAANGVYQPPIPDNARFVAFSAFAYNYEYTGAPVDGTLAQARAAVDATCRMHWRDFAAMHPRVPEVFSRDACLNGVYFNTLLVDAYGIPANVPGIVKVARSSEAYSWTAGAVSYITNQLGLIPTRNWRPAYAAPPALPPAYAAPPAWPPASPPAQRPATAPRAQRPAVAPPAGVPPYGPIIVTVPVAIVERTASSIEAKAAALLNPVPVRVSPAVAKAESAAANIAAEAQAVADPAASQAVDADALAASAASAERSAMSALAQAYAAADPL